MTINELNALTALTAGDELPVWDAEASGEPTKKITAQNMANSVKTLANLQGTLTFDSVPTTGSTNPVTSAGIKTAIAQSTAVENVRNKFTPAGNWCEVRYALRTGHVVYLNLYVISHTVGGTDGKTLVTIDSSLTPAYGDYCYPCIYEQAGTVFTGATAWIEHGSVSKITLYGNELQATARISMIYFVAN